jgi:hypothetical protein
VVVVLIIPILGWVVVNQLIQVLMEMDVGQVVVLAQILEVGVGVLTLPQ